MSRAVEHFEKDLDRLVDRYRQEYDMTYAEVVGCLHLKQVSLWLEAREDSGEEDE